MVKYYIYIFYSYLPTTLTTNYLTISISPSTSWLTPRNQQKLSNNWLCPRVLRCPNHLVTASTSWLSTLTPCNRRCHAACMAVPHGPYNIDATMGINTPRNSHPAAPFHPWHIVWGIPHVKHPMYRAYRILRRTWTIHCFAAWLLACLHEYKSCWSSRCAITHI